MKGYFIFEETIHDAAEFERYKSLTPQTVEKYSGAFVVRGGTLEAVEGAFDHQRLVIIAFPSVEAARAWYDSEDYAEAKALRQKISTGNAFLVEGV